MNKKSGATKEDARRILKDGILNMSVERLIQMSKLGLMGNITEHNGFVLVNNVFDHVVFNENTRCITFLVKEADMGDSNYGSISFVVDSIRDISGCVDKDNPDEYLNVNIRLQNNTEINIRILY